MTGRRPDVAVGGSRSGVSVSGGRQDVALGGRRGSAVPEGDRESVLVLRALGLGDALTGIAPLRGVRRAFPDARLVLAAPDGVGGWLRDLGVVDDVLDATGLEPLTWPAPRPPDVAVNLHGRGPQSHELLQALDPGRLVAFACPQAGHADGPGWVPGEHEVDRWCRLVRWAGGPCGPDDLRLEPGAPRGDDVVVHPGAAAGSRRWPAERWVEVVRELTARGSRVVVTGVAAEDALCAHLASVGPGVENRCGRLDLPALAQVVASASLVLCGDTGIGHLATAYGTPSVLLFGPVPPSAWGPALDVSVHRVLWAPKAGDPTGDPHGEEVDVRLARIGVEQVLAAATASSGADTEADAGPGPVPG